MTDRCPHCNQRMPPKGLPDGVVLTPQQKRVWEAVTLWPGMNRQEMMDYVYGHNGSHGADTLNVISVYINNINKKIGKFRLKITGGAVDGYRLEKDAAGDSL